MKKKIDLPSEKLKIDLDYPDFTSFYEASREKIYRRILEMFEQLLQSESKQKFLIVEATVDGFVFDAKYLVSATNKKYLTEVLLPFFESLEDYETCNKIIKMSSNIPD